LPRLWMVLSGLQPFITTLPQPCVASCPFLCSWYTEFPMEVPYCFPCPPVSARVLKQHALPTRRSRVRVLPSASLFVLRKAAVSALRPLPLLTLLHLYLTPKHLRGSRPVVGLMNRALSLRALRPIYTSSTPTHTNNGEQSRDIRRENTPFCRSF
jgi:hypothetical protein